ncbi:XdhC family protein [Polaromonas sp.]|jgi:xanthine dehydrogenase accessory factor|uniref:XdhC family protein n=1 Tax=Polaromonas sp. TaxID=1869339 RepID=UPI002B9F0346|nr:XdhC family protein [Polaromonas sp.]HQS31433.1 XdhC family protein [Polaromonas sp.]HQS90767.1 XdhC family protein [Polaromonas sp.]
MNRHEWITQAARLQTSGQAFALVTVLSAQAPTSGKAGDKAVVTADGQIHGWIGGGCAQPAVIKTVRRSLLDGQARKIRIAPSDESAERELGDVLEFGMACHSGGTLELFVDPVMPAATLTVVGDSPVARALVGLAPRVGLRVAVVAHGAQAADFPEADRVLDSDAAAGVCAQLSSPFVVVATQGRRDVQGLKAALALQPQGLWFVASAKKASVLRASLVSSGEDAAAVARIVAPAGEFIGAQTPEEIALSVLTSVVAARRGQLAAPAARVAPATAVTAVTVAQPAPSLALAAGTCCGSAKKASALPLALALEVSAPAVDAASAASAASAESPAVKKSCCGG